MAAPNRTTMDQQIATNLLDLHIPHVLTVLRVEVDGAGVGDDVCLLRRVTYGNENSLRDARVV
jgi:hypothetical protein